MKQLIDFLNHGIVPFVGRAKEKERLLRYWEQTFDADGLRAFLLLGEAGIGKSSLLQIVSRQIESQGGVIIHAKLLPESALSISSLLPQSIWYSETSRQLLPSRPGGSLPEISTALRRLARLRPLLLIIEDIHLLGDEAAGEFAQLLEAVASEPLSLLCGARPHSLTCRNLLERFLVDEIMLPGLSSGDIGELLQQLFDMIPEPDMVTGLRDATGGNPLALRGALRSTLRKHLEGDTASEGRVILPDPANIVRSAQQSADMLARGILSHLLQDEQKIAQELATLGEVVSRTTALQFCNDAEEIVQRLVYKGILSPVRQPSPLLAGNPVEEDPPLKFTHSLLHQRLVEEEDVSVDKLLEVIGQGMPLYSLLPLRIVGEHVAEAGLESDRLESAIRRIMMIARQLNGTTEWPRAGELIKIAMNLFQQYHQLYPAIPSALLEADLCETQLWLMNGRLGTLTSQVNRDDYREYLARLLALTSEAETSGLLERRIDAWRHQHMIMMDDYPASLEVWDHVDHLIERFPSLFLSEAHLQFLVFIARTIARHGDSEQCRRLKDRVREMLENPEATEKLKNELHIRITLPILPLVTTKEELEENLEIARKAEENLLYDYRAGISRRASFENAYTGLLFIGGYMHEATERAGGAARLCRDLGQKAGVFQNNLTELAGKAGLGMSLEEVMQKALLLSGSSEVAQHPGFRRMIGTYLAEIGLLHNNPEWTTEALKEFAPDVPHHYVEADVILALQNESLEDLLPIIPDNKEERRKIRLLIEAVLGKGKSNGMAVDIAREWLTGPLLGTGSLLSLHATILLVLQAGKHDPRFADLKPLITRALHNGLAWLNERRLFNYMSGMLERYPDFFSAAERKVWKKEIAELSKAWKIQEQARKPQRKTKVSMLGTITLHIPGQEPKDLRGSRLKTMLGLLVGDQLLETPLSRNEFHRIATGEEDDPNLARKNTNMAVIRLREALGADAIQTGDETYQLDPHMVEVDLWKATALLDEALQGLRHRSLLRATPPLLEALTIINGEVAFPGLYDEFFETLRDDIEARLRRGIIEVSRTLLYEGDPLKAEEILRKAFGIMPEDEEILELLEEALTRLDKRVEAARVRAEARRKVEEDRR